MTFATCILSLVTLQRLAELIYAEGNARRLLANGGREVGASHYLPLIAVHVLWLVALWWFGWDRPVSLPWLGAYLVLQAGRAWVLLSLGRRWTTRIIVLPGAPLVRSGPYRFLSHPNYVVLVGEIAVLPLVFGLWEVAALFTLLNAAAMVARIRSENAALAELR